MKRPVARLAVNRSETEIIRAILDYLALCRIPAWRMNTGAARLPGRGGKPQLVRWGTPGTADILGIIPPSGRLLALEIKRQGKQPTAMQAAFLGRIRQAGGVAYVVSSIEDVALVLLTHIQVGVAGPGAQGQSDTAMGSCRDQG